MYFKSGGSWRHVRGGYFKSGGAWRRLRYGYQKSGGRWRLCFLGEGVYLVRPIYVTQGEFEYNYAWFIDFDGGGESQLIRPHDGYNKWQGNELRAIYDGYQGGPLPYTDIGAILQFNVQADVAGVGDELARITAVSTVNLSTNVMTTEPVYTIGGDIWQGDWASLFFTNDLGLNVTDDYLVILRW